LTPFDMLWAGDLLGQVGFGPGDRVLDLAGVAGRGGGSTPLPFCDASFDVVVCQQGLQVLPDRVQTAHKTVRFPSVVEFLRRYLPGSPAGAATTRLSAHDRRQILADLEAALAPWVDADGLRVVTEANTAIATR
jgi:hypothetical protein